MAEWISLYCRRPLGVLDEPALRALARRPDYLLSAEVSGIPVEEVEAAVKGFTFRGVTERGYELTYPGALRPIQVARHHDPAWIKTVLDELPDRVGAADAERLRARLGAVVELVDFELGWEQAEGVGGLVAEQFAFELAELGDALVDFYGNEWFAWDDRVKPLWRCPGFAK